MTTIDSYSTARNAKTESLKERFAKLPAHAIKAEIDAMRKQAHKLPMRQAWQAEQLRIMANVTENHFFLILNPKLAFGENLSHALAHSLPIP